MLDRGPSGDIAAGCYRSRGLEKPVLDRDVSEIQQQRSIEVVEKLVLE